MREHVQTGTSIDGYRVDACIHNGGTGSIYRVDPPPDKDPGFPIIIKAPRLGRDEATIGIDSFEMERTILPTLTGPHVPRFVAAGDVTATPYIVMEWIDGEPLSEVVARAPLPPEEVARIGAALADAVHSLHAQDVVHLDLKPENFMLRATGEAVLLDFGFAHHSRYPDLLAEEQHFAAGSAAYVSPEQLLGDRSDPRSDLFALGVLIYELATGEQPFGQPQTLAGMRDRLWREPVPPRARNERVPAWLQEIILRCLEQDAAARYPSAAHIALDLRHPEQMALSARAERTKGVGLLRKPGMLVARAPRADFACHGESNRGPGRTGDHGRRRYRAPRRRAALAAAMDDGTNSVAQPRVPPAVRIGREERPGGRRPRRHREHDAKASRA